MKKTQQHKELETIVVLVLSLCVFYWHYKNTLFLLVAFVLGLTGLFLPVASSLIHRLWMKLAECLGFVINKIILTIVFIIIVIPLGWLAGKLGKSSIQLKSGSLSYFKERNHVFIKEDLEHPW
jgi:hypothetical protein